MTGPAPGHRLGALPAGLGAVLTGMALMAFPVLSGGLLPANATVAVTAADVGGCAPAAKGLITGVPWAQQSLAPQRAWNLTRGGGVVVGVVDTGVSAASPALSDAVLPGRDLLKGGGRADDDCSGHGTFVAGLLAARPTAGSAFAGIAPGVQVLPVRVTTDASNVDAGVLAAGIRAAVDGGAQVVAVALGATDCPPALRGAVAYAVNHNVLVVASTEGANLSSGGPVYPAALPGVLAVASFGPDGKATDVSGTAARPTLAAPGANLVSIAPHGGGNVIASGSGVSVAFVAGAAALVRDYRPGLTATQLLHRLETTADHPSDRLPDRSLGYGIVDPVAAVVTMLPEESGEKAPPRAAVRPIHLVPPPSADERPVRTALAASAAVAVGAALGGLTIALIRRGRRRGWRPGGSDETVA
ncbi:S8 family serine peptidase [Actinoallomurus sp. NPDC050550]|uniref:S8 family serine peptidase n=1 Tax=Actinoallomurus sp. NPDC050550 TaxID=3154937 RepID=UPI0033ECDE4B